MYNVEQYLVNCLDSILKQSYLNYELLLIDDGSNDDSSKICDLYELKNKRIKCVHNTNSGVSSARNIGLSIANGKYVTFIDSDDTIEKNYVSELYDLVTKTDSDISFVSYNIIYNFNIIKKNQPYIGTFDKSTITIPFTVYSGICCTLFKNDIIKEIKLCFNETMLNFEDSLFIFNYIIHINKFVVSNISLYNYYMRCNSAIHTFNENYVKCRILFLYARLSFLKSLKNMQESLMFEFIQAEFLEELLALKHYYSGNSNIRQLNNNIKMLYNNVSMDKIFRVKTNFNYKANNIFCYHLFKFLLQHRRPVMFITIYELKEKFIQLVIDYLKKIGLRK